jgi:hypothetical protein
LHQAVVRGWSWLVIWHGLHLFESSSANFSSLTAQGVNDGAVNTGRPDAERPHLGKVE